MIELDNRTSMQIKEDFLNKIATTFTNEEIELIITKNTEIQKITKYNRNVDKPTDVLSFPYEKIPMGPLGSIVISSDFAKQKAIEFEHTITDEISLLFIHGLLHLLGYNHETDNGEMREKENYIIKKFKLPDSLIVRTQG